MWNKPGRISVLALAGVVGVPVLQAMCASTPASNNSRTDSTIVTANTQTGTESTKPGDKQIDVEWKSLIRFPASEKKKKFVESMFGFGMITLAGISVGALLWRQGKLGKFLIGPLGVVYGYQTWQLHETFDQAILNLRYNSKTAELQIEKGLFSSRKLQCKLEEITRLADPESEISIEDKTKYYNIKGVSGSVAYLHPGVAEAWGIIYEDTKLIQSLLDRK